MVKIAGEKGGLEKVLWYYGIQHIQGVSQAKIVCPFHDDINPSMIVDFEHQSWFCFGCNKSGDAFKFSRLMEAKSGEELDDLRAYQVYTQVLRSPKASDAIVSRNVLRKEKKPNEELFAQAWDYYYGLATIDWLRDSSQEVSDVRIYMGARGFSPNTLQACGAKVNYSHSYGLIFPMLDNGEFKGWVCRTMIKSVEEKRKYLYNEGFSRATTLVGDYGSKNWVVVVEGYMDRLKMIQNGLSNVVAILGWKMSDGQVKKLRATGIKHVISALDNDTCGRDGTEYLKNYFKVTRFSYIRGVKDPGDMDKKMFDKMFRRTKTNFENDRRKR